VTRSKDIFRSRSTRLAATAIGALMLSACANQHHIEVGAVPDDYRTNHPIVVSEQERTLDIPVASGDTRLTVAARGAIRGYAQRYSANASGTVRIMVPSGSYNANAAALVASDVRSVLASEGVPHGHIITTAYHAAASGDAAPIRLSYLGIAASTGECGRWPEDILANGNENKHYANFGCASQSNLAAQIANPMDLIAPRGSTPIDAERRGQVIIDYRADGAAL
jgi:pilus assembly protein CpaD